MGGGGVQGVAGPIATTYHFLAHDTRPYSIFNLQSDLFLPSNLQVSSFVPVDPNALQVASTNLPGEIGALAHACPIGTLRKIARSVAAAGSSPEDLLRAKQLAAESVFANMDGDEKLLASCLFSDLPPFDESMAWAMGRKVLDEDVVRWRVAWNGLIEVGWVTYNSDLGFLISHLPSLIPGGKASELPQEQWDIYVNHWVDELVRITLASQECTSVLESFRHNLPHFRHVFEVMCSDATTTCILWSFGLWTIPNLIDKFAIDPLSLSL